MSSERIYTIGHGGRTASTLLDQLKQFDIQYLIDVRSKPYSRHQPDFARESLSNFLSENGIKYVFMGEQLGGMPKDSECYTEGKVDYEKCRSKAFFRDGIERLRSAYSQGLLVCLLCSESKPWQCHRSKLIATSLAENGIEVFHLLADGSVCTQDQSMRKITGGQESFFGEHLTSRRAYR
jgi:uncharacterized protein (DUF488 family)